MRDFRDAKVMAHAVRDALKAKAVEITHSESLELIANAFGIANWNLLSAKIEAARPRADDERGPSPTDAREWARPKTLVVPSATRPSTIADLGPVGIHLRRVR